MKLIPQDIIYNVIAAVGDDKHLLQQCALVSSSFLLPTRKQLFSGITLSNAQSCRGIHQFLVQNPVIQSFVRTITVAHAVPSCIWVEGGTDWIHDASLPAILRLPFCHLERFSIYFRHWGKNWCDFSIELKVELWNIIHSSTLKSLSLDRITGLPIAIFLHIVHLTTLELSISPNSFHDENSNSLTWLDSTRKGVPVAIASHTVVDRLVWHLVKGHKVDGTRDSLHLLFSNNSVRTPEKVLLGRCSCHSCAVYASFKSTPPNSVPQPILTLIF